MAAPLHGLVLAGGKSRRMGRDKALLERDGVSQLEFAYSLLQQMTDACFVSVREDQADGERGNYPQIVDRHDGMGPIAGILSALESHADADWLVVACDLPNLDLPTLQFLIDNASEEFPFTAYRSSYDDLPEPLCAIYRAGSRVHIQRFLDEDIRCPRKMLIRSETQLLTQPNPRSLDNVNTPDDLERSVLGAGG